MRKIVLWFLSTVTALVLLFSYRTSTNTIAETSIVSAAAAAADNDSAGSGSAGGSAAGGSTGATSPKTSAAPTTGNTATSSGAGASSGSIRTFTGDAVNTRWGPVQVQITVQNGTITQAQAVEYPTANGKDRQINAFAIPTLNQEVLSAQDADIDAVSGATVTSDGYIESLQSALDQANL